MCFGKAVKKHYRLAPDFLLTKFGLIIDAAFVGGGFVVGGDVVEIVVGRYAVFLLVLGQSRLMNVLQRKFRRFKILA